MSRSPAEIEAEIRAHRGCGFEPCETATNPVPGQGNPNAEILFVGEAPGAQEDAEGRPFVGRAGQLLDRMLGRARLRREEVYITNVLKHRPPGNRNPRKAEVEHEWPWLEEQIEAIEPRLIVPLGRYALDALAPGHRVTEDRGRVIVYGGRDLYPVFHPSAALRSTGVLALLREDFSNLPAQRSATAR
jgi:DNA polymerase